MNRIICANLIGFLFVLGLTSCATISTPPDAPTTNLTWTDRQAQLNRLNHWQLNGKIAVYTAQDSGSATVDWLQQSSSYTVSLYGPLGAGNMTLSGNVGSVTLEMPNGKRVTASNPEELLAREWGFNLPVSYLTYWVRGLPAPGTVNTQFDHYHRLTQLTQEGWRVQFLGYTTINKLDLPNKIEITSPQLRSKIVIYSWKTEQR